ncbi:MAG: D-glycero-beta-D-manno-heptose 1,7-bisphosphate 7-phosphatase [Desulfobacterales bacterium]
MTLDKVVFLDRDGVINRDSADYIKTWSEFEFLPRSIEALAELTYAGFSTIVITNQSVINRNMVSGKTLEKIHDRMTTEVCRRGGKIKDIFFCPHVPEDRCSCRKPKPGLILRSQLVYRIDLAKAFMVGDSIKDIECAKNAGCGYCALVRTGNGRAAEKILSRRKLYPDHVAEDLYEAVHWIISQQENN